MWTFSVFLPLCLVNFTLPLWLSSHSRQRLFLLFFSWFVYLLPVTFLFHELFRGQEQYFCSQKLSFGSVCAPLWNESESLSLWSIGALLRWICYCSVVPKTHSDFPSTGCSLKNGNTLPPPSLLALRTLWGPARCKMRDLSACRFQSRCLFGPPCRG